MFHRILRKVSLCFLIGLYWLCISSSVFAATNSGWFARAWQSEDGLPEHTIVGLAQTSDGYLWVATHRSLTRFDGVRFQEYSPATPTAPKADQIRVLLLDRRGRLWLAKDGGNLHCLVDGVITNLVVLKEASAGAQARAMAEDLRGDIWLSDSAGAVFRIQNGNTRVFGKSDGLPGGGTCWLATDVKGTLWFAQAGEVGIYRDGRFKTLVSFTQQSTRIAQARQGGIWVSTGLQIFRHDENGRRETATELRLEPGRHDVTVTALYEDQDNGLWVGTSSEGLFRIDSTGIQNVRTSNPNIINILEDAEGNFWVSTRGGGINRLSPRAVQLVGPTSGLPFASVQSACEDSKGNLWAAGQNGALACRSNGVWNLLSHLPDGPGSAAVCVLPDANGGLLIGTKDQGVFRFRDGGFTPHPVNPHLPNLVVRAVYASVIGDLWVAIDSGVVRFRSSHGLAMHFPLPDDVSDVRTMVEDASQDLWLGTRSDGRLLRIRGDSLSDETINVMRGTKHIRCLEVTSDGSLWMGFAGEGLGWIKDGRFFQFRTAEGLADEFISQILFDNRGRLYIGSNRGIFQVARSELEAVARGHIDKVRSVVFGREEGVPNLQATFGISPNASRCNDGRLLMPMLTGLAIVQPNLLRENPVPPPVIIERLAVNGRLTAAYQFSGRPGETNSNKTLSLVAGKSDLHLDPGVNRMEVEFTAPSFVSPENVIFRYQLEGLDEEWIEAGTTRVARYPHIPPGNYRFRVTACNHDGIWNDAGAVLNIIVKPHLWEATWFRVTGALFASCSLGGIVLLTVRGRYRRKLERLERQQALEKERARIAQDLHDDLGAGLVEINFGSELAQDPSLGADEVREHTREIGARAKEMVTALDEIVWAVNPKHDSVSSLATYFCQFAQHFLKATSIRCHLDIASDLPSVSLNSEQRHSLFLAFKEALSNVVQHSGASDLKLAIAGDNNTLTISVSDNGCGLVSAATVETNGADGLSNMQERLKQLGGRCRLMSDLKKGTTVIFEVPLQSHPLVGR